MFYGKKFRLSVFEKIDKNDVFPYIFKVCMKMMKIKLLIQAFSNLLSINNIILNKKLFYGMALTTLVFFIELILTSLFLKFAT